MKFNERIKNLRIDSDLTQEQIAKIFNSTQRKISRLENGITEPNLKDIEQYCYYYNLSADYILGFINEPKKLTDMKKPKNLNTHVKYPMDPYE